MVGETGIAMRCDEEKECCWDNGKAMVGFGVPVVGEGGGDVDFSRKTREYNSRVGCKEGSP